MKDEQKTKEQLLKELHALRDELHFVQQHDPLTGLPNRHTFYQQLAKAIGQDQHARKQGALCVVDLDRFHYINDVIGHELGDQLLIQVARRIVHSSGANGCATRYGADQFVVFLPELETKEDVEKWTGRLLQNIERVYNVEEYQTYITAGIGVSLFPEHSETPQMLVQQASMALYEAKKSTTKCCIQFFDEHLQKENVKRFSTEVDLRQALDQGEFLLHYQPQHDIKQQRVIGIEALIRWQHPEKGLLSPKDIIPIAEETGLIIPIGQWVLREACRQNRYFQDQGFPPIQVAVNVSAIQLRHPHFVQWVEQALAETGLAPQYLALEVTENVLIDQVADVVHKLKVLKEIGVQIIIDDFGTGYSSLKYLKDLYVDKLKIDQSFVRDVPDVNKDVKISTAIIDLAHDLEIQVLAEGVETEEQKTFFTSRNCFSMQGYLFSKPIEASFIEDMLSV